MYKKMAAKLPRICFLVSLLVVGFCAMAQTSVPTKGAASNRCMLGFSLGVNNPSGMLGINFSAPPYKSCIFDAGVGISTWGLKFHAGGVYFLKSAGLGWGFGGGLTYSTGGSGMSFRLPTVAGDTENVKLDLKSQTNLYLSCVRFWSVGAGTNRFFAQTGVSVPLTPRGIFTQRSGNEVTVNAANQIATPAPGGLMLSCGLLFRL
jgi:hypothetical protein